MSKSVNSIFKALSSLLIRLAVESGPIPDSCHQVAHVNEIETVGRKGPLELGIIKFESTIWRDKTGHCIRKIRAYHFG
jgi:hypothetical protein